MTSLERVLWPAVGFTKGDMLAYYEAVAPVLLPHLEGRPLTLGRFPAGVEGPGFATTECRGRPDWVRTVAVTLRSGEVREQCGGIGGGALEKAQLRVDRHDGVVGPLDVVHCGAAGAQKHRLTKPGDVPQERECLQVSRCDFEGGDIETG